MADHYHLFISHSHADAQVALRVAQQLTGVGITCFLDQWDMIPGTSSVSGLTESMEASDAVAVFVAEHGIGSWHEEEAKQAQRLAIDRQKRAFIVWMPGSSDTELSGLKWLGEHTKIDLRDEVGDDGLVSSSGMARLVAGALNIRPREAASMLAQRPTDLSPSSSDRPVTAASTRDPACRALIVTTRTYDCYDELPAADYDRAAVNELLRETENAWAQSVPELRDRARLSAAVRDFFTDQVESEDTLLLYFSGHGVLDEENVLRLCTAATDPRDLLETAFSVKQLANYVKQSVSGRKIVVLDCCFAGEAGDVADWGEGTAVITSSRQWSPALEGVSELTGAFVAAWSREVTNAGELFDAIAELGADVRANAHYDRSIPLPHGASTPQAQVVARPAARLEFNQKGDLAVRLSDGTRESTGIDFGGWMSGRHDLVTNLMDLVEAVVSLVPPDQIPMDSVNAALSTLGTELLNSTITSKVRADLVDIDQWRELRLQIRFDDKWKQSAEWERLPWEALALCQDNRRDIWLERIVEARATKSAAAAASPPRRVIAWSAFVDPAAMDDGSRHLFTQLLRRSIASGERSPSLVVKEPAAWTELFDASKSRMVEHEGKSEPITDFDTMVLFAPVTFGELEPEIWLYQPKGAARGWAPVKASAFASSLSNWTCSYVILETAAVQPTRGSGRRGSGSLQATTALATRIAREMNATVIAVCHSARFLEEARPTEETAGLDATFSGALLRELADPNKTVYESAVDARRWVNSRLLGLSDTLHIGLPVVCRPEVSRAETRSPVPSGAPRPGLQRR